jgi:hypothetical protein
MAPREERKAGGPRRQRTRQERKHRLKLIRYSTATEFSESKPAGPSVIAAGPLVAATGIDNAIDPLDVVTTKMDKASIGQ